MAILNVNTDEVVRYSNKLEKLHRSAFPIAIRGTLNNAAFDVKQKTMPVSAEKEFVNRQPNFFKANSKVNMAKGFNVRTMQAEIGFTTDKLKGSNQAVEDLEQQEHGGIIKGRTFIPNRTGVKAATAFNKNVKRTNRVTSILAQKRIKLRKQKGSNWAIRAIKASIKAGVGGLVQDWKPGRGGLVWRVKSIKRIGLNTRFERVDLLYINKSGNVRIKTATGFMKKATLKTAKKLEGFYIKQAKKQIEKALLK